MMLARIYLKRGDLGASWTYLKEVEGMVRSDRASYPVMLPWEVKLSMGELMMLKEEYSEAEKCFLGEQDDAFGAAIAGERQVRLEEMRGRCYAL